MVRNNETQTYEDAEVKVLAKEDNKYEVTIPAFSDMDGVPGQVGPVTFEATGTESEGNTVLTAENRCFLHIQPLLRRRASSRSYRGF